MSFTKSAFKQWLLIGLLLSNLVLGGLSFVLLHELDSGYTRLISQSVPILTRLHELTSEVMHTQRALSESMTAASELESRAALERAERSEARAESLRLLYQRSPDLVNGTAEDRQMDEIARQYGVTVDKFTALVRAGQREEASAYRLTTLRQAADRYYDVIDRRVTQMERRVDEANRDYTASTGLRAGVVLTLASWPVLGGLLLAVIMAVTLIALALAVFAARPSSGHGPT